MNKAIYIQSNNLNNIEFILYDHVIVYKSSGIVYCNKYNTQLVIRHKNKLHEYVDLSLKPEYIKLIDIDKYNNAIDTHINYIISNTNKLYPEQNAGYTILSIFINFHENKNYEYTISSVSSLSLMNNIINNSFIVENIIYPHFGIIKKPHTKFIHNSNDGALSIFYEEMKHLSGILENNIFTIYWSDNNNISNNNISNNKIGNNKIGDNKIGHIELIIGDEIEIKHILLDLKYRSKQHSIKHISSASIAYLLEILGARYAPFNPMVVFKHLEHIASKLEFHKIKYKEEFIYKRLCRLQKYTN